MTSAGISSKSVAKEQADTVAVSTSAGSIALTSAEAALLDRLERGTASLSDATQFYGALAARDIPFPMEWERLVLRASLAELPDRTDLLQRLAYVEEQLQSDRALDARLAFERAWVRFGRLDLVSASAEAAQSSARTDAMELAGTLLTSSEFTRQPVQRRCQMIGALHDTLMSAPSADLAVVAELGLRQFESLLAEPDLTEPAASRVYDALHSLYFSGVVDVRDLRRFDRIAPLYENWLERKHRRAERPAAGGRDPARPLTIAYLLHVAHFDRGNAVSPLIVSLAEMHAKRADRRILLYAVQYIGASFEADIAARGIVLRQFPQDARYDRMEEIAQSLRADGVDIVCTEQNRALAASLFVRRVAHRQVWIDTGFPFWNLRALDWTISPVAAPGPSAPARTSPVVWRQTADTLKSSRVDRDRIGEVRAGFPEGSFVLGVFVRLVKLDAAFYDFLKRLLAAHPRFHLVIGGPGDPSLALTFAAGSAGRVTFVSGMVDLNVYGPAIDLMCDTFPFIGGNACREVSAHGTPVIAKLGTSWDALLRKDRNPDLLARNEDEYIALAVRMADDGVFRARQRDVALEKATEYTDPQQMIEDVEAAIAACLADD